MDTTEGLQKNILDATLRVFDQKGLKFTMDDLAKELSIRHCSRMIRLQK